MPSPNPMRRSARSALLPTKPLPATANSPASSLSSATRNIKANATNKSATPHSLSSEEPGEHPRRSQRAQPAAEKEDNAIDTAEDGTADEEEITRCICGAQDYPGAPLSEAFDGTDASAEDAGGLFIQCDGCSVWQHGGCVGIVEESQSPDKYFCEECRPKQHELHTDARGQKYSLYLPLHPTSERKGSVSKSDAAAKREREMTASRASVDPGRRRATMRSKEHDDEEEQLQRALEESKKENAGRRNGKRARDDGEETKQAAKRQRTLSESITSATHTALTDDESDDEGGNGTASRAKKVRADAVQSARQAELREKEVERENARAVAAGRRQERAGRRRVDEADADTTPRPNTSAQDSPPASSQPGSPNALSAPEKISHKKGAGKKTKKLGNNQYTKARDLLSTQQTAPTPVPQSGGGKKRAAATAAQKDGTASSADETSLANGADSHQTNTSNSTTKNSPGHDAPTTTTTTSTSKAVGGKPGKKSKAAAANHNGHVKHPELPTEVTQAEYEKAMDFVLMHAQQSRVEMEGLGALGLSVGGGVGGGDAYEGVTVAELIEGLMRDARRLRELVVEPGGS